jgi:hypothetical protein
MKQNERRCELARLGLEAQGLEVATMEPDALLPLELESGLSQMMKAVQVEATRCEVAGDWQRNAVYEQMIYTFHKAREQARRAECVSNQSCEGTLTNFNKGATR